VRDQIAEELPDLVARHHARSADLELETIRRRRWATQSYAPSVFMLAVYGGGMTAMVLKLSLRHEWAKVDGTAMVVLFGWGIIAVILAVYFVRTIRKARRELLAQSKQPVK